MALKRAVFSLASTMARKLVVWAYEHLMIVNGLASSRIRRLGL